MNKVKCPECDTIVEFEEEDDRIDMKCENCGQEFCAHRKFPTRTSSPSK